MREEILYKRYMFPIENVTRGEDIVIWGGGILARDYIRQNNELSWCNIKYIVDTNWENLTGMFSSIEVCCPQRLKKDKAIKVVIAVIDANVAFSIKEQLRELGLDEKYIVWNIRRSSINWACPTVKNYYYESETEMRECYGDYYVDFLKKTHELLHVKRVANGRLTRVGRDKDGGYVMLDDFEGSERIAYSFGIDSEVSWDRQMVDKGYELFMYDHTINGLPEEHANFHFFKKGLADRKDHSDEVEELRIILNGNNHGSKHHMILKIDVEGCEYGFLRMTDSSVLKQFDQIVMELHGLTDKRDGVLEALEKLTMTHQVIHIHADNYGGVLWSGKKAYPDALEVTLVNKESYEFVDLEGDYRLQDVDKPCDPTELEISLVNWTTRE